MPLRGIIIIAVGSGADRRGDEGVVAILAAAAPDAGATAMRSHRRSLIAGEAEHSPLRRELSLDVFAIVSELPAAQRSLCEALMGGLPIADFDRAEQAHHLAELRARFAALGLHESQ